MNYNNFLKKINGVNVYFVREINKEHNIAKFNFYSLNSENKQYFYDCEFTCGLNLIDKALLNEIIAIVEKEILFEMKRFNHD